MTLRQPPADLRTASLAGLAVTLGLVVAGLFLTDVLRAQAAFQDCLLAGRADCVDVVASRTPRTLVALSTR